VAYQFGVKGNIERWTGSCRPMRSVEWWHCLCPWV